MTDDRVPKSGSAARLHLLPLARRAAGSLGLEPFAARYVVPRLPLADPSLDVVRGAERRLAEQLAEIRSSNRPIVVGPWLAEVGIELLYWVPFLRALRLDPSRVVAVSRGGVDSWYAGIAEGYADVFEHVGEDEFRKELSHSWIDQEGQKQYRVGDFDRRVLVSVAKRNGLANPHVLHPSTMLMLFSEYWRNRIPLARVLRYLDIAPLTPPAVSLDLPERYVAARFYFRETFPDDAANRALVGQLLELLGRDLPVVLLDTGVNIDDHEQVPIPPEVEVLRPLLGVRAEENLRLQSVVLAGADSFAGTYGGLCYLANAYGVPSFALLTPPASEPGLRHGAIGRRIATSAGTHLSIVSTTAVSA
ncbi:MAG TPA: hypothetical protein VGH52_05640 [Gaiellaceae bacterium]